MERYHIVANDCGEVYMEQQEDGQWVRLRDHLAEVERLRDSFVLLQSDNDRLRNALKSYTCKNCNTECCDASECAYVTLIRGREE
jgi:hypothetical protein